MPRSSTPGRVVAAAMILLLAAGFAGCSAEPIPAPARTPGSAGAPTRTVATAPPGAAIVADATSEPGEGATGRAVRVEEHNDLYSFVFAYPAEASAIPALKARFDEALRNARTSLESDAREAADEARRAGYPYRAHDFRQHWETVTQTPRFLSLSAETYTYTGGAHGMTVFDSLLWEKKARRAREPMALFISEAALNAAVQEAYCAELDRQREKKRGKPVNRSAGGFNECIEPIANSVVILGSRGGKGFDRIGFLIAPYNAGPYAEGSYEVTLPVTDSVLRAVKPAFRNAFSPG